MPQKCSVPSNKGRQGRACADEGCAIFLTVRLKKTQDEWTQEEEKQFLKSQLNLGAGLASPAAWFKLRSTRS